MTPRERTLKHGRVRFVDIGEGQHRAVRREQDVEAELASGPKPLHEI